jgi:hypothetical protein
MSRAKRSPLMPLKFLRDHPAARAFHAPQRQRVAPVQHPKPRCGMCEAKVHTRVDFTTGDGWWLCPSCDTGAEVGMARAA